ncbi:MAG: MMPL family transporter [Candidatus Altiarchaeota archaeon]|nr:MMPL family transporter [Candidatus Altiarchaeota archaeon]
MLYEKFGKWYSRNYKKLIILPILAFLLTSLIFVNNYRTTGELFQKDIDLSGGIVATLYLSELPVDLRATFEAQEVTVREIHSVANGNLVAVILEAGPTTEAEEIEALLNQTAPGIEYDLRSVGPSMGESFMTSAKKAVIISFILMGIILAAIFRQPIVALTVIVSGFLNVYEAAALMTLFGIKLSPHTIGALLMLMGWGVDSEVLFDSKIFKGSGGKAIENALEAMKTAMTMSAAVFAILIALYVVSSARMIKEIALVLLLGALFDIINTWFQSLSMVLWFVERQEAKRA